MSNGKKVKIGKDIIIEFKTTDDSSSYSMAGDVILKQHDDTIKIREEDVEAFLEAMCKEVGFVVNNTFNLIGTPNASGTGTKWQSAPQTLANPAGIPLACNSCGASIPVTNVFKYCNACIQRYLNPATVQP
jgi:hypothetical protein